MSSLLRSQQEQKDLKAAGRLSKIQKTKDKEAPATRNTASGDPSKRRLEQPTPSFVKLKLGHFWLLDAEITQGPPITYRADQGNDPDPGESPRYWIRPEPSITTTTVPTSCRSYFATGDGKEVVSVFLDIPNYPSPPSPSSIPEIIIDSSGTDTITGLIKYVEDGYIYGGTLWIYYWVYEGFESCIPNYGGYTVEAKSASRRWNVLATQTKAASIDGGFDRRHLVLPTGNGNFIVVAMLSGSWEMRKRNMINVSGRWYPGPVLPTDSDYNVVTNVFACNNHKCRSIALPSTLQKIIDSINPQYTKGNRTRHSVFVEELTIPGSGSCPPAYDPWRTDSIDRINREFENPQSAQWNPFDIHTFDLKCPGSGANDAYYARSGIPTYEPDLYNGLIAQAAITPAIFETLNTVSKFVDPAQIKTYPDSKRWLVEANTGSNVLRSYGYYSIAGNPYDNPDGTIAIKSNLTFVVSAPYHPDFPDPTLPEFTGTLYSVWDWDDPVYCRNMCLSLGFTIADLTP